MEAGLIAEYCGRRVTVETSQPIVGVIKRIDGGYVEMSDCTVYQQSYFKLLIPLDHVKSVLM